MTPENQPSQRRRTFLTGIGAAAATVAAPSVSAQESETGIFTEAAIPDSAPTFDGDGYVGLFVHVSGPGEDKPSQGVDSCSFAGDGTLVTWDAVLVDKTGESAQESTTLHAKQGAEGLQGGSLFVVNDQQDCGDGFVQVSLEKVGASKVDYEGTTSTDGEDGEGTVDVPGFGPVAALAGVLGAGWLAKRRGD